MKKLLLVLILLIVPIAYAAVPNPSINYKFENNGNDDGDLGYNAGVGSGCTYSEDSMEGSYSVSCIKGGNYNQIINISVGLSPFGYNGTVCSWVKTTLYPGDHAAVLMGDLNTSATNGGYAYIYANTDAITLNGRVPTQTITYTASGAVLTGWGHYCYTWNGTNASIYLNGTEIKNGVWGYHSLGDFMTEINGYGFYGGGLGSGYALYDDWKYWNNTALNNAEILEIYNDATAIDNFRVTAKDFFTSIAVNTFNVTINQTVLYTTTNGTIVTNLYQDDTTLYNVSVYAPYYENRNYTNQAVTSNLIAELNSSLYLVNITAKAHITDVSLTTFSLNISSLNSTNQHFITTTNGSIPVNLNREETYRFTINASNYLTSNETQVVNAPDKIINLTAYDTGFVGIQRCNLTINTSTLNISFFDIGTTTPTSTNGTYIIDSFNGLSSTYTDNTTLDFCIYPSFLQYTSDLELSYTTTGEFNYFTQTYDLTNTTQFLNIYLEAADSSTIFTLKDKDTTEIIDGAYILMYRYISGSWNLTSSKYSDISGKVKFAYVSNQRYKFEITHSSYNDYEFELNPILFSTYDVYLVKSSTINVSPDFNKVNIYYSPKFFYNDSSNTFTFTIRSPSGILNSYGYHLVYPSSLSVNQGTATTGETMSSTFTITNAVPGDRVTLSYWYDTNESDLRNFTSYYPIVFGNTTTTMIGLRNNTYGLGLFERIFIVTFVLILVVGIGTLIGQPLAGFALGLLIWGFFAYIGFISYLYVVLILVTIGLLYLAGQNT